ncbi:MAG: bifunctional folylpolyglutamate synthase/dihydrofolate synthase [Proteobacteria bacterium]|nr:bifunctional folylpolyglutamate synthase/dihydrofolate synthase [Pseudomonadota bacterium]MBU1649156.1 bifunctional folylpolyglutamate synthase/dihydrofolate synthase [Pseudomonadota bacterium]MBU1986376.1 bifunctional folylpolyglutamate synthase/dihydrofolate synthase [Pseudomonadota bacterium]
MNYQEAQIYLEDLQFHKIKLGLDSMCSFLARVGHPEQQLRYVHVAGTNGKGSVSVTLLTLLAAAGYRVGLYTSPHLSSVRERFRINEEFISREKFAELATRIKGVLGAEKITYFEFTTALALLWFAESGLDLVILETGLGGRLDATNVVVPLVSVITNVTMDHEAYLGTTVAAVAAEKAGIIKDSVPVVSGVAADEGLEVVSRTCRERKAPLYLYGRDFHAEQGHDRSWSWLPENVNLSLLPLNSLRCFMRGSYQIVNASLALATLALLRPHGFFLSPETIRAALEAVRWPGRLECICLDRRSRDVREQGQRTDKKTVCYLLDGAHNPAGVESLVLTLRHEYEYKRLIVVWGAMLDKDLRKTLPLIGNLAGVLLLTRPDGERAAEPEQLLEHLDAGMQGRCECVPEVDQALMRAEALAAAGDLIVVAGSLYLVGAVRKILLGELVTG